MNILLSIIGALILGLGILIYTKVLEINHSPNLMHKFTFTTLEGKIFNIEAQNRKFKISEIQGKIIFLKIFGWDCNFCQKEIPQLIKLKNSLPNTFEAIAIQAENHSNEKSKKLIKEYGINYHIVSGKEHKDFYKYLQEQYGWEGIIPLTIVLSKEGKVLAFEAGSKSYSLSELLKASLLKK